QVDRRGHHLVARSRGPVEMDGGGHRGGLGPDGDAEQAALAAEHGGRGQAGRAGSGQRGHALLVDQRDRGGVPRGDEERPRGQEREVPRGRQVLQHGGGLGGGGGQRGHP